MATITREQFTSIATEFVEQLAPRLPHLTTDEIWWRIGRTVAVIVDFFGGYPEQGLSPDETEEMIHRLVNYLTAAMEAPSPKGAEPTEK